MAACWRLLAERGGGIISNSMTICVRLHLNAQERLKFEVCPNNHRVWITQDPEESAGLFAECDLEELQKLNNDLTKAIELAKQLNNG